MHGNLIEGSSHPLYMESKFDDVGIQLEKNNNEIVMFKSLKNYLSKNAIISTLFLSFIGFIFTKYLLSKYFK